MLFDAPAESDTPFALWHRPSRRHKWRVVGRAATGAKALALMDGSGHRGGDWILTEGAADPNDRAGDVLTAAGPSPG